MTTHHKSRPFILRLQAFLASDKFFWIVIGIFIFQAAWIALTARYPQAFDEQFHYGVIKLYAAHGSPFWHTQPAGADQFGAVTRDPSFLYHYLLSFPYRVLGVVTQSDTARIIILRLLNVGFMAAALIVFRRVLTLLGSSKAMTNVVLAFVAVTPVVALLAAQINYDNLFTLLTAIAYLAYLTFHHHLRRLGVWSWPVLSQLVIICLLASIVKYAFLPIALGIGLLVLIDWRYARRQNVPIVTAASVRKSKMKTLGYAAIIGLCLVLCSERYIVNTVRYHTPIPECDQVLTLDSCQSYAPWARNYMFDSWNIQLKHTDKLRYPFTWIHIALGELTFVITSNYNAKGMVDYYQSKQMPVTDVLAWVVFIGGSALGIFYWRTLRGNRALIGLLGVAALYVLVLFGQNLLEFLHLGLPVAIHGRYLMPILPLLYLVMALGFEQLLSKISSSPAQSARLKVIIATTVLVIFAIEGGGFTTFIVRSSDSWFWQQSRPAQLANQYARDVLKPFVIGD